MRPKTRPILDPNPWRRTFGGVCFCAPTRVRAKFGGFHISAHGHTKNAPDFRRKPSSRDISGRMQYAPTRVRAKFGGFHIPAPEYVKNAPGFTFPNKDTPKTCSILDPNLWRGTFRGVCNTPLYGYKKNLAGFRCKPLSRGISGRMLLRPYTGTCKTRPVLGANPFRRTCRGVCNTPLHGYVQNLSGFTFPHTDAPKTHPILPFPIRIHRKPARFYTQTVGEGHFRAYAIRPYTGTCKIWRVLNSATRHDAKPGGFWTLPHDIARNPAGFGLCHTTWHETRRVLDFATRHSLNPGGFLTLPLDIA